MGGYRIGYRITAQFGNGKAELLTKARINLDSICLVIRIVGIKFKHM
jgi:hypothetical protein